MGPVLQSAVPDVEFIVAGSPEAQPVADAVAEAGDGEERQHAGLRWLSNAGGFLTLVGQGRRDQKHSDVPADLQRRHAIAQAADQRGRHVGREERHVRAELERVQLTFPLHFYISDEWFTPDGTATMAVGRTSRSTSSIDSSTWPAVLSLK